MEDYKHYYKIMSILFIDVVSGRDKGVVLRSTELKYNYDRRLVREYIDK